MLAKTIMTRLYDYNYWANHLVWNDCIMHLNEAQFSQEIDYSLGTIRRQCWHMLTVEEVWIGYLYTGELNYEPEEKFVTRADIRTKWESVEAMVRQYLDTLTDSELQCKVIHPSTRQSEHTSTVWEALLQVANHGTDHRAQILSMLHQIGAPTVAQDLLNFVYDR